jgi:hypothetical protein
LPAHTDACARIRNHKSLCFFFIVFILSSQQGLSPKTVTHVDGRSGQPGMHIHDFFIWFPKLSGI